MRRPSTTSAIIALTVAALVGSGCGSSETSAPEKLTDAEQSVQLDYYLATSKLCELARANDDDPMADLDAVQGIAEPADAYIDLLRSKPDAVDDDGETMRQDAEERLNGFNDTLCPGLAETLSRRLQIAYDGLPSAAN